MEQSSTMNEDKNFEQILTKISCLSKDTLIKLESLRKTTFKIDNQKMFELINNPQQVQPQANLFNDFSPMAKKNIIQQQMLAPTKSLHENEQNYIERKEQEKLIIKEKGRNLNNQEEEKKWMNHLLKYSPTLNANFRIKKFISKSPDPMEKPNDFSKQVQEINDKIKLREPYLPLQKAYPSFRVFKLPLQQRDKVIVESQKQIQTQRNAIQQVQQTNLQQLSLNKYKSKKKIQYREYVYQHLVNNNELQENRSLMSVKLEKVPSFYKIADDYNIKLSQNKPNTSQSRTIANQGKLLNRHNSAKGSKKQQFTYALTEGNNQDLIARIMMETRLNQWTEVKLTQTSYCDFLWQPFSCLLSFRLSEKSFNIYNHFEFHKEISNKSNLLLNIANFAEKSNFNPFTIIPISFYFDLESQDFEKELKEFIHYYNSIQESSPSSKKKSGAISPANTNLSKYFVETIQIARSFITNSQSDFCCPKPGKNQQQQYYNNIQSFPTMNSSFNLGKNIWIFKPCDYNRGRGVEVFSTLSEMNQLLVDMYFNGVEQKQNKSDGSKQEQLYSHQAQIKQSNQFNFNFQNITLNNKYNLIKPNSNGLTKFIIQKYMEDPFLIYQRKFDIRIWVLTTNILCGDIQAYVFKEGYIRTSSQIYKLDKKNLKNKYIHLTNNAIQKQGQQYGQFEDGNQISYKDLKQYITSQGMEEITFSITMNKIKEIIQISLKSVKNKLNKLKRKNCYEIFGYDFILDKALHPWLIEVNTNPCIEESSSLLKILLPRMLDDAFKLTIDKLYPPEQKEESIKSIYPVQGYSDQENLWENISLK